MTNPALLVIAFSVTIISIAFLFSRPNIKFGSGHLKIVACVVIGFLGVFAALVVSNPVNSTAVFGLLGALIGFVVGKTSRTNDT